MASPRIGPSGVKQIINTTLDPIPFIETASALITDRLTGKGLSENILREIERYLAAHFMVIYTPQIMEKEIGDAREKYSIPFKGEGLKSTRYGQQVLILDSSGTLANLGKRAAKLETIDYIG